MLESGSYAQRQEIRVTAWPAPDADGTGDVVWREKTAPNGQSMGREKVRDSNGNEVRNYPAPEGFRNFPSFDHTSHFLRETEHGEPVRNPAGETIEIIPGSILLEYSDGTSRLITDEYEIYLFEQAHNKVGKDAPIPTENPDADKEDADEEKNDAKVSQPKTPNTVVGKGGK